MQCSIVVAEREGDCVKRRRQHKPSNTQEPTQRSTQQRTTKRRIAELMIPNQTPSLKFSPVVEGRDES